MRTSIHPILLTAILAIGSSPAFVLGGTAEDAIRDAERDFVDAKTFDSAASYRAALGAMLALPEAERAALVPEAEAALYRLDELSAENGDAGDLKDVLGRMAAMDASKAPGSAREAGAIWCVAAHARYALGYVMLETGGAIDEARKTWQPLGFLEGFRVIGPFDNERGGQFATELEPEKELRLDARYDGKKRPVVWRTLPAKPLAGQIDLGAMYQPNEQCLAYALTFVEAKSDTDAALRFGSDEGFRAWVNGALVASGDVHRRMRFDQNAVGVHLAKGWNSILFKITQTTGDWGFLARLTRLDGAPLEGVVEGLPPDVQTAPRLTGEAPAIACESGAEALLRSRIESEPAGARAHYLLGTLLLEKGAHDESEHPDTDLLRRAVQLDASPGVYYIFLARSQEREATIAAQKDDNAWRETLEQASERGSALADYLLADYYKSTFGSLTRARSRAERALQRSPQHGGTVMLLGAIDEQSGVPLASQAAADAVWKLPRTTIQAKLDRADRLAAEGKSEAAEALFGEVLKTNAFHGEGAAFSSLADNFLHRDREPEALALLEKRAGLEPFATEPLLHLAQCLEGRDRLEDSLQWIDASLAICPENHALHQARAKVLLRLGRKSDALASMDRALELQPNLPDVREYVEFLRATKSGFEDEFRRDSSSVVKEAFEKKDGNAGGEPARILLELTAIQVNHDGTTKTFSQNLVQILNDRGIRMYDRFHTHYAKGEQVLEFKKAKVWHADGTFAEGRLSRYGSSGDSGGGDLVGASIDLPSLTSGDIVEVEYVREDLAQSFFGDYFGHQEVFQQSVPIGEKVFTLRVPADRKFYFHLRNMKAEPHEARDEKAGTVTYTWSRTNVAKLDPEPGMPDAVEVSPVLEISTFESWDAFNRWYWNLIKKQQESSPEISKKVRELVSGADTEIAKIRAIYNFVVTDVHYNAWEFGVHGFKPYNAATIFARRFGDCKDKATLITVMLREAGIKSQPVLIEADETRGAEDFTLPMVNHFNHCIAYAPPSGGRPELFLDGTAQFHAFTDIPSMDRGATVLVVGEDKALVHKVPWNIPAELSITEEATVAIQADLGAEIQVRAKTTGDFSVFVRQQFEIETQRRTQLEKMYGRRFAASSVKGETFSNLLNLDEPVSFGVTVAVPRFVVEAPEGLSIRAAEDFFGTGQSLGALGSLEKRVYDVLLGSPRSSSLKTVYVLPDGFKVKALPPAHDIKSRFGRLQVAYEEDGPRKLVAHRVIEVTSPRISVADYPDFREFAATVGRLEDEKIVLERS